MMCYIQYHKRAEVAASHPAAAHKGVVGPCCAEPRVASSADMLAASPFAAEDVLPNKTRVHTVSTNAHDDRHNGGSKTRWRRQAHQGSQTRWRRQIQQPPLAKRPRQHQRQVSLRHHQRQVTPVSQLQAVLHPCPYTHNISTEAHDGTHHVHDEGGQIRPVVAEGVVVA